MARLDPPHVIRSQVVSACQSFRPVAQFFFWLKNHSGLFFFFFEYRKGVAIKIRL